MARLSGKDANITFAAGYVVGTTDWTVDVEVEDVDTTALGDTWRTHLNGLQAWSGSFTSQVDAASWTADLGSNGLGVGIAPAAATFQLGTGDTLSGSIMVTGMSSTATVGGGANTLSYTFVGSGALAVATV